MKISRYLPSGQFIAIAASLFISAGLVYAAQVTTHPSSGTASIQSDQTSTSDASNWQAALYAEQAANASTSLQAPDPNVVNQFLAAAKSNNLTDTVARTMLINLTNAKAQGLGDDVPTQDQIISAATAQIASAQGTPKTYTTDDLRIVSNTSSAKRNFGNNVIQALNAHPNASEQATLLAIDQIVEGGDTSKAATLKNIGAAYKAMANDLTNVAVPETLAPLYIQMINNYSAIAATYDSMATVSTDAVRGLAGLRAYENLMDDNSRVFINIAQSLNKDGILFTKDEPGNAWSTFLSASTGS